MSKTLSSDVVISRRFLRSVRIDGDYGRIDALDGFVMQPSSSAALEILAKHINETQQRAFTWTGPYGGGKSSLALALASLVHSDRRVQQEARRVLGVERGDALYKAFDATPGDGWTVLPILGRRGSVHEEIAKTIDQLPYRRKDKPPISKRNVIAELVTLAESPKRRGVLLIIDELGKFLEHAAKSGDDIFFYQELAEAACRAHGKFVVLGVLHQAFEQYASRLGRDSRDEWAKVQGRFLDIALAGGTDEIQCLQVERIHVTRYRDNAMSKGRTLSWTTVCFGPNVAKPARIIGGKVAGLHFDRELIRIGIDRGRGSIGTDVDSHALAVASVANDIARFIEELKRCAWRTTLSLSHLAAVKSLIESGRSRFPLLSFRFS